MRIVLLTPGTGSYHCGVCMRDNALAKELIRQGHDAVMLPMYLPLTLDEEAADPTTPIFFGGVVPYLREKVPLLRRMPRWLDRLLSQRFLLRWLAGKTAAKTGGPDVAEMTLSMLRGEQGNQAGELEELIGWLRNHARPEAIWLSTALQAGLAKRLRSELRVPILGFLQGEDSFIDGLGTGWSAQVWALLAERMRDADQWIAPSRYFADLMSARLGWGEKESAHRIRVIPNGISTDGFPINRQETSPEAVPVIGYLARFIPAKGLGLLVAAFIELRRRGKAVRLHCAGSMTEADGRYVNSLQERLQAAGFGDDVTWQPNVSREEKISFLQGLSVFSVPATYSEAFGMYVIEALAAGVPVVQPRSSAFREIVAATSGGRLFELGASEAESATNLADALATLLAEPHEARAMGERGRLAVATEFSIERLAAGLVTSTAAIPVPALAAANPSR